MSIITQIKVQEKDKTRVSIYLDGEFCCGLDYFTLKKHRLVEGMEITDRQLYDIRIDSQMQRLMGMCIKQIVARPRSKSEMTKYIMSKGADEDVCVMLIEKLEYYGYLNDEEFASYFIQSHRARWGMAKIKLALRGYGISASIIQQQIEKAGSQQDEAYNAAQKYLRQKECDYNKLFSHLYTKGFSSDDIKQAINRIKNQQDEQDE